MHPQQAPDLVLVTGGTVFTNQLDINLKLERRVILTLARDPFGPNNDQWPRRHGNEP
jgi:hypothetical protein